MLGVVLDDDGGPGEPDAILPDLAQDHVLTGLAEALLDGSVACVLPPGSDLPRAKAVVGCAVKVP